MSVTMTITDAGRAALINATNTGTRAVTIAAVGVSSGTITPSPTDTTLAGEIKRLATIGGTIVDAHTIHIAMEDASSDTYALNAFALYLSDGTLFALYGQATPIFTKAAASIGMLAIDIVLTDASLTTDAITVSGSGFTNPPASTTLVGVTRFATTVEAQAGTDATIALTPAAAAAAVLKWLRAVDGTGSGIDTDLWRGQTPDELIAASFSSGSNANGNWSKIPDGKGGFLIEQWGTIQTSGKTFDFPIEFPQQVDAFVIGNTTSQGTYVDNAFGYAISTRQFYAGTKASNNSGANSFPVAWIAKGR